MYICKETISQKIAQRGRKSLKRKKIIMVMQQRHQNGYESIYVLSISIENNVHRRMDSRFNFFFFHMIPKQHFFYDCKEVDGRRC